MANQLTYEDIETELRLYEFGRTLRPVVISPAWEILVDTIKSYVEDADLQVRKLVPGDPSVVASQAALYALDQFFTKFQEDVKRAVDFAAHPSQEITNFLLGVRDDSDVLKQQNLSN